MKKFNELTPQGQTRRLNKYEKERQERGTTEMLVNIVKPAKIKEIKDGNKIAIFRLAAYDKEAKETKFFTANAFIKAGKDALEKYYASLAKGQLCAVEYKTNDQGYNNIYKLMDRSYAQKKNQAETPADADLDL